MSDLIGWKCIQRRNFSILEAYERGADVIAIIDDDNIPKDNWGKNLSISSNDKVEVLNYELDIPVFDPLGAVGCDEFKDKLWHRGFPLELLPDRKYDNFKTDLVKPSIQADLWDGEPDVDAICRMMYKPVVESWNCDGYVYSNKLSPFNSQNTFMTRDVIRDYFLFPHIGRMDDIWASYYVQSVGHKAVYGKASVYSDRALGNAGRYSVIEDMKREYLGYENNLNLVEDLEKDSGLIQKYLPEKSWDAFCEYKKCIKIIGD